jgi:hypothetical protein
MTRLFLAAGVAALAIAVPTAAKPGGGHGGGDKAERGGGQQAQPRAERQQMRAQRQEVRVERRQASPRFEQRAERQQTRSQRVERVQQAREQRFEKMREARSERVDFARKAQERRFEQAKKADKRVLEARNKAFERRNERVEKLAGRRPDVARLRDFNDGERFDRGLRTGFAGADCPPGLAKKAVPCVPPGQAKAMGLTPVITAANADYLRRLNDQTFQTSALRSLAPAILAPSLAANYLGMPLSALSGQVPLMALPQSVSYLYPDTNDYYYRYGNGYLYQVDRGNNLVEALLPLLTGGLLPGSYLPSSYMNSYVPNSYGLNSFYPANYANYGGYDDYYGSTCNRYADGVVYQVDCGTGLIRNAVPTYAAGYGVGQMLPSAYNYYNLPTQYRSLYQPTDDYSYWYAPGAIYQTDPSTNLITSVAALLAPGLTVGQQLPAGYGMYNVPMGYRDTYYDTADAWYRYNNGNIYQIDPTTQLVTAIVASLLT